jgi:hypothetical protein
VDCLKLILGVNRIVDSWSVSKFAAGEKVSANCAQFLPIARAVFEVKNLPLVMIYGVSCPWFGWWSVSGSVCTEREAALPGFLPTRGIFLPTIVMIGK